MPQVTRGILLASVLSPSGPMYHLAGVGDPNLRTEPEFFAARAGSLYSRADGSGPFLYVCTVAGVPASGSTGPVAGVWVGITAP